MTRRPAPFALAAAALALGACHPKPIGAIGASGGIHISTAEPTDGPVKVATRLSCPETSGDWTRTAAAADGATCSYTSPKGVLDLAFLSGAGDDPQAALAPERARLDALMPSARAAAMEVDSSVDAHGRRTARVDMPFLHVRDDGDRKSVSIMGLNIDKGDSADHARADDDAPAKPGSGVKLIYLLAGQSAAPGGYHAVGYKARADASGRLVVASFKLERGGSVRSGDDDDSGVDHLLNLNAPATDANAQP